MSLGKKLAALRKARGLTQEQLAEVLAVSRQAVSKWESDAAIPETEKLIRLSELYGCSLDHLIRDGEPADAQQETEKEPFLQRVFRDRRSKRTICGLPLWHFGLHARGIIAIGPEACGVLAIGLLARGVFPIGFLSLGLFSFGWLSLGFVALGLFALGIFAAGAICAGVISAGAISFGLMSFGAVSIGSFSVGALAIGKYAAIGDHARGMIALGQSEAYGSMLSVIGELSGHEAETAHAILEEQVPFLLKWAKAIFSLFIR